MFSEIVYFVDKLLEEANIDDILQKHGATKSRSLSDSTLSTIISTRISPYTRLNNVSIITLIESAAFYSSDPALYFSGITVSSFNIKVDDVELLYAAVSSYGGQYEFEPSPKTTHILSYDTTFIYQGAVTVHPRWIEDSILAMQLLPMHQYSESKQTFLESEYPFTKVSRHSIYISSNLNFTADLSSLDLHQSLEDCTQIYITDVQDDTFALALRYGCIVGTSEWLEACLVSGHLCDPALKCLHYPRPIDPIPEFKSIVVTISGYSSKEKRVLRNMIELMGGSVTGDMTKRNTHLCTKYKDGEKFFQSGEWNIVVVSSYFIERCFVEWKLIHQEWCVCGPVGVVNQPRTHIQFGIQYQREKENKEEPSRKMKKEKKPVESEPLTRKRASSQVSIKSSKKPKTIMSKNPLRHKFMYTGITPLDAEVSGLNLLSGHLATSINICTLLIAPRILRTEKMLMAMNLCIPIVHHTYVIDTLKAGEFLDVNDYLIKDKEAERNYGFSYKKRRSIENVFGGMEFIIRKQCVPGKETLRKIIESGGGKVVPKTSKENVYRIGCNVDENDEWYGKTVYSVELILTGSLRGSIGNAQEFLL